MSDFNCPNCGGSLSTKLTSTKMVDCPYCDTTVLLADDGMKSMGQRGIMAEYPSLINLGQEIKIDGKFYFAMGHARFNYGRGWWDEYWCQTPDGERWVSVDEGDYAIEEPMELGSSVDLSALVLGETVSLNAETFTVTEIGSAVCEAIRGEFPEEMRPGDTYQYWHLTGRDGRLVTLEEEDGEVTATEGRWIDPFTIEVKAA